MSGVRLDVMRRFWIGARILALLPLLGRLTPIFLMIALGGPEIFLIKRERETILRYWDKSRRWVLGELPDRTSFATSS